MRAAKQRNGLTVKFTVGNQSTKTRLVFLGKTFLESSIASHSSHGSNRARSIGGEGTFVSGGGQVAVTNPICSPSIGTNPLSLNPSSTACRARNRNSACSLYGPASSITPSNRTRPSNLVARWERRSVNAQMSCDSAAPFLATPFSICSSSRSEEHTPELQSPDHLVCRLLLEKKKDQGKNKESVAQQNPALVGLYVGY